MIYWHLGNRRFARVTTEISGKKEKKWVLFIWQRYLQNPRKTDKHPKCEKIWKQCIWI